MTRNQGGRGMTEAEEMMRKAITMKQKNYFPIKIQIDDGKDKGKVMVVNRPEDTPLGIGFTVLETHAEEN